MPTRQLPWFINTFKDISWQVFDSVHYRFHYLKESLTSKEINVIAKTQENAYSKITAFLEFPSYPQKKISYYFYPDSQTKERLMGNSWFAHSIYKDFSIHALY